MTGVWRSEEFLLSMLKEGSYGQKSSGVDWAETDAANIIEPIGYLRGYEPPDPEQEWIEYRNLGHANSRKIEELVAGKFDLKGSVPYTLQNGKMLAYALGSDSFDAGTHTITASKILPSFVSLVSRRNGGAGSDYNRIYTGQKIDQFSLASDDGGELKAAQTTIAQNIITGTVTAAPAITCYDDDPYWFKDSTMTFWGSEIGRLQDFELTISNNLKPKRYFKSAPANTLSELLEGSQRFEVKATITVDDSSILELLRAQTPFDFTMEFERAVGDTLTLSSDINADNSVASIGSSNGMCQMKAAPHAVPDSDEVNVPVTFTAKNLYARVVDDYGSAYI